MAVPHEGSPGRLHRRWSDEFKASVAAECLLPGAKVSAIAARVGIDRAQLYQWRTAAIRKGWIKVDSPETLSRAKAAVKPVRSKAVIEIVIDGATLRVGSDVDAEHLQRVLKAVKSL